MSEKTEYFCENCGRRISREKWIENVGYCDQCREETEQLETYTDEDEEGF